MCKAKHLQYLALDGLSAGQKCKTFFFPQPNALGFHAAYTSQKVEGVIPRCLIESNTIKLLHMSGNALFSSLPSDVRVGSSLASLALNGNDLTGSIPLGIQRHGFNFLDLSYNKFDGTLATSFVAGSPKKVGGSSLSLSNNRLSGDLPVSFYKAPNLFYLNVLQGNLFGCNVDNFGLATLPLLDAYSPRHHCGSDQYNITILIFGVLAFGLILAFFGISKSLLGTHLIQLVHR